MSQERIRVLRKRIHNKRGVSFGTGQPYLMTKVSCVMRRSNKCGVTRHMVNTCWLSRDNYA